MIELIILQLTHIDIQYRAIQTFGGRFWQSSSHQHLVDYILVNAQFYLST